MRIRDIRISGFRSIPFCAEYQTGAATQSRSAWSAEICWSRHAFEVRLPVRGSQEKPMLSAIMGANSAGKSTVLLALKYVFSSVSKLDPFLFNCMQTDRPVIIELTLLGSIGDPTPWHATNCVEGNGKFQLTVAHMWTTERRTRYIRRADGIYYKQTKRDRAICEALMPEFRMIWADTKLDDEADLEKKNLISDLVEGILARDDSQDSVICQIRGLVSELTRVVDRSHPPDQSKWQPIEELEASLSQGLASITPQRNRVRLQLIDNLPSLRNIFAKGIMYIDDGVELDFEQHGLGLQRSFVVSALNAWCEFIRDSNKDYLFAIEEPEIYLHPHATRVLLNILERIAIHDQVVFTTHASEFINRVPLHNILTVKRADRDREVISQVTRPNLRGLPANAATKAQRYLREDRSDMLFARAVLLVEGQAELFAIPSFARILDYDLDSSGVSVVFVNGFGNFETYHHILSAFTIPHVILMDGDGHRKERERTFGHLADAVFVLDHDFETLLVAALSSERLLFIVNKCLRRQGRSPRQELGSPKSRVKKLSALGKPLVGRVAGEMLARDEVERMPLLRDAIERTMQLAFAQQLG